MYELKLVPFKQGLDQRFPSVLSLKFIVSIPLPKDLEGLSKVRFFEVLRLRLSQQTSSNCAQDDRPTYARNFRDRTPEHLHCKGASRNRFGVAFSLGKTPMIDVTSCSTHRENAPRL